MENICLLTVELREFLGEVFVEIDQLRSLQMAFGKFTRRTDVDDHRRRFFLKHFCCLCWRDVFDGRVLGLGKGHEHYEGGNQKTSHEDTFAKSFDLSTVRFITFSQPMNSHPFLILSMLLFQFAMAENVETPDTLHRRGMEAFFKGEIKESLKYWDQEIALQPQRAPYHWQLGLALYYAGEFEKGVAQFVTHQTVNGHDVENAVWHFLCVTKAKEGSLEKARKNLIPIEGDTRIPMKQIHELFGGKGTAESVLAVSKTRNDLCYAHLYLGLYEEALGDKEKSLAHIKKAAVDYKMDHYMGRVAQVHYLVRKPQESAK